jgi:hypothetical protein
MKKTRGLLIALMLGASAWSVPGQAQYLDCAVSDPKPPLDIHDFETDAVIGKLNNGEHVFLQTFDDDREWGNALIVVNRSLKEVGRVKRKYLDCSETDKTHNYPYVFKNPKELYRLGLKLYEAKNTDPTFHQCFSADYAPYDLSIADSVLKRYTNMPFQNLCLVLRQAGLRYDPETGQRLATYITFDVASLMSTPGLTEADVMSDELPLEPPPCFHTGKVTLGVPDASATLKDSGCVYRYHPWSGRRLQPDEAAALSEAGLGLTGEKQPGTPPETARIALDRRHWQTGIQAETQERRRHR